ncbi:MAG: GH116 family glycosyl-hydrolase, partial [Candidatus Limnocylindrales bacterium]
MTATRLDPATEDEVGWPVIPAVAWRRPIGLPCPDVGHPRVRVPMIDDGEWAGVPVGGLGTGSIGRTFRGDAARWHLDVGRHRFEPVAADGFSLFVGGPDGTTRATVLSALRPTELTAWGWDLPVGGGTYHALFPRAWQTFEPEAIGVRLVGEQLSPVIAGDLERSALPVGVFEWWVENPGPDPLTIGLLFSWADPPGGPAAGIAPRRPHETADDAGMVAIGFGDITADGPTCLRGTLAMAAARTDGWEITASPTFDPIDD